MRNKGIEMKNGELIQLMGGFEACAGLKGVKFAYAIARNTRNVRAILEDLGKTVEHSDAFKAYDKERIELCKKYCKKDNGNEPIMKSDNSFDIIDKEAFSKEMAALKDKHAKAIKEQDEKIAAYAKLLDEECDEFEPYIITTEHLPEDITASQMTDILPIVEEVNHD